MNSGAAANVKAKFDMRPTHSQVFLVSAVIVVGIAVICSMILFMIGQPIGGSFFLLFAAVALGVGYWAWIKSQSDVDLEYAQPTQIALPDGTKITTDSRTLRSIDGLRGLTQLCAEALNRKPLPDPDGLVDANAQVISNSKADALAATDAINKATQAATNALFDALGLAGTGNKAANLNLTQQISDTTNQGPVEPVAQDLNIAMATAPTSQEAL